MEEVSALQTRKIGTDRPINCRSDLLLEPVTFVIGMTGVEGLTANMVARVREGRERNRDVYDTMFKGIDALTLQAIEAMHGAGLQAMEVRIG